MKIYSNLLLTSLVVAIVLSFSILLKANAQVPITSNQIEQIRGNCVSLKNTLNQLHASDALLRVNMGQRYELMFTKLMDRFNGRLSGNKFNNNDLLNISTGYQTTLDTFRLDYITYEESLVSAIKIDCSTQPVDFYNGIITARANRSQVYKDIVKLNQNIDTYRLAIGQFESYYQSLTPSVKQ